MKKILVYIFLIFACSFAIIYFLNSRNKNYTNNAFIRKVITVNLQQKEVIELPTKSIMFTAKLDTSIILTSNLNLLNFYKVDDSLTKMDTIVFKYPTAFNSKAKNIYKDVLPPNSFSTNPYGDIAVFNGQKSSYYKISDFRFDFFQAISPKTVVVRARYNYSGKKNRSIAKLNLNNKVTIEKEYPLPDFPNGLFTNDGVLIYDKESTRIFYMYFYRGEFLSLDTNLNLKYIAKTIDITLKPKIETRIYSSRSRDNTILKQVAPTTPPKFVNINITIHKNLVYILSTLKAANETSENFEKNQVIDVYNINNGKYLHSFYVPKYKNIKFDQFQIRNNTILAIHRPYLVKYRFQQ